MGECNLNSIYLLIYFPLFIYLFITFWNTCAAGIFQTNLFSIYVPFLYAFVNSRKCCIPAEPHSGFSKLLHVPSAVRYISVSSHGISTSQFGSMSARLKCSSASSSLRTTSLLLSPSALRKKIVGWHLTKSNKSVF